MIGGCYNFASGNGLQTASTVGSVSLVGVSNLTLSAWFNTATLVGGTTEWDLIRANASSASTNRAYSLNFNGMGAGNTTGMTFLSAGGANPNPYFTTSTYVTTSTWHMLTLTYSGGTSASQQVGTLYLDGVVYGTAATTDQGGNPVTIAGTPASALGSPANVCLGCGLWGSTPVSYSWTGSEDDAGVWNETLDAAHVKAMYNTPLLKLLGVGATLGSTDHYGQLDMQTLFKVYAKTLGPQTINGLTWSYSAALPGNAGHNPGDAWYDAGSGSYDVELAAGGLGVTTTATPEPSTLALLAAGLAGLLCYAWRKRK